LFITDAIRQTVENVEEWKKDYVYDNHTNEFNHCKFSDKNFSSVSDWFKLT